MPDLHIHFATMTGNAETVATDTQSRATDEGWTAHVHDLGDLTPQDLTDRELAVFIVSTWGDGEPPDDAADFWYALEEANLDLSGMRFAVFGLGDKDYTEFNGFARQLDARLATLGATRLLDRFDADLDFDETFPAWADRFFTRLAVERETSGT
ncbi:flavodoxin domain-containing protein [Actomonas aquatica]|uniref:Flavodoxin domain-containing protein n=1 Tax=Actomonas aquatica TaxID=2866162 RepID=A0ABZ1C588_9BACT|nr:flavodoxin domain-containing protein [Opitutus sp. WL0086]WRQ86894.1 flavodoxin domain-containing protein [Opitutus sp. WL0086]